MLVLARFALLAAAGAGEEIDVVPAEELKVAPPTDPCARLAADNPDSAAALKGADVRSLTDTAAAGDVSDSTRMIAVAADKAASRRLRLELATPRKPPKYAS